ncbi:MAG: LytR C-terminal domain-containing protein [Ilumatobacteraceae bacterium]
MTPQALLRASVAAVAIAAGVLVAGFPDTPAARIQLTPTIPTFPDPGIDVPTTPPTTSTTLPPDTTETTAVQSFAPTTTAPALTARADITVIVANATGVESVAGVFRDRIKPLGYSTTYATVARELTAGTTVYGMIGFEDEALRLATEVGLGPDDVVIVDTQSGAPAYSLDLEFELLVIVGTRT